MRALKRTALAAVVAVFGGWACHHEPAPAVAPPLAPPAPVSAAAPEPPPGEPSPIPVTEEWVHFPIKILYPSGGSGLDDQARAMMSEFHDAIAGRTDVVRVQVEGHAVDQGSPEANERLGLERAQVVVDYAAGVLGMPRELFEVISFGDTHPIGCCGETREEWLLDNRRVEFSILFRRQAPNPSGP